MEDKHRVRLTVGRDYQGIYYIVQNYKNNQELDGRKEYVDEFKLLKAYPSLGQPSVSNYVGDLYESDLEE